jgi:D-3-phosphoglycerate dehydrogenase
LISDFDAVIAGTEEIDKKVFSKATKLKFISRVGIGLDSLDLRAAKDNNVKVSYTPDAPAPAVAELTLGLMINLARSVTKSNLKFKNGEWQRYFGQRLSEMEIGIIGGGRIGRKVINYLQVFSPKSIFLNDIEHIDHSHLGSNVKLCSKEFIYKNSDLISLHLPLTKETFNMITIKQLETMKTSSFVVNTSRGGIINEQDLFDALEANIIAGAAVDTYENEPYFGNLAHCENCINTAHMGSMSSDCRSKMEIEATKEVVRFLSGTPLKSEVPEREYSNQLLFRD